MTIPIRTRRAVAAALLAALVQAVMLASPAAACACGALEPGIDEPALVVDGETALVRHDGRTEDVLLSFGMGSSTRSAALILPLPAKARLSLGDVDTFPRLAEITRPRIVERKVLRGLRVPVVGGAAAPGGDGAPGVDVLEEGELGPFTTTQLASDDAGDLRDWLEAHDYRVREDVVEAVQPYLDEGWIVAAIQLTPGTAGSLTGDLQPIRASFTSDEIVYPMRLQANATRPMPLRVYTLAAHRLDMSLGQAHPTTKFAGSLAATSLRPGSTLADLTAGTPYLTRHDVRVRPEDATTDATFARHADDAEHHEEVVVVTDYPWIVRIFVPSLGTALLWAVVLTPVLLIVVIAALVGRLVRGPRQARTP